MNENRNWCGIAKCRYNNNNAEAFMSTMTLVNLNIGVTGKDFMHVTGSEYVNDSIGDDACAATNIGLTCVACHINGNECRVLLDTDAMKVILMNVSHRILICQCCQHQVK